MAEVAGGGGIRRRLPPWMQSKASTPASDRDKVQEVEDKLVSGNSRPTKQSRKAALPVEKGETKRKKREVSQQDPPSDNGAASPTKMSIFPQEKQVQEPSRRGKRKVTSVRSRSDKDIPSPVENDDELTPEDLLSIAEEYVKADKNVGPRELSTRECDFGRQLSTTASPKAESESSLIAIDGNRKSPADETTSNSTRCPKDDKILINTSRTGDPTQDMLDLFLGPLLKKTVEEKRSEFIMRDPTFSNELGKGGRNDVKEEAIPLTKKKCTLRDKVAMLLD